MGESKCIGILTSGGDCPGLNAAIRAVGKSAIAAGMTVIGFKDGFRGLMENRMIPLTSERLSGILTIGGTILGTSRDKPNKMPVGGKLLDMTEPIAENCRKNNIDVLVCIGGGGTQKNAYKLMKSGVKVVTLPKTIDNDVSGTDATFGFDTALDVATGAIDRIHSTADSHHRIMLVEVMGHKTGWLTLGAGLSGGADVIIIPEIPYSLDKICKSIMRRRREGKHFSIIAVAEGAVSVAEAKTLNEALKAKEKAKKEKERKAADEIIANIYSRRIDCTVSLSKDLESKTGLESRVTILGYLQRGGTPSAQDRILATRLGSACVEFIKDGKTGVMVGIRNDRTTPVPLEEVVGKRKDVPLDHDWIQAARNLGVCLGD